MRLQSGVDTDVQPPPCGGGRWEWDPRAPFAALAEPRGLRAWGKDGERRRSQAWERWGGL